MAQKQGGSKKPRKRPGASVARAAATKRKEQKIRDQKARENHNKSNKPTPWQVAKAERAERRQNVPMQGRTKNGNIVKKLPDGTTMIIASTQREQDEYLAAIQKEKAEDVARRREEAAKKLREEKKAESTRKATKKIKKAS